MPSDLNGTLNFLVILVLLSLSLFVLFCFVYISVRQSLKTCLICNKTGKDNVSNGGASLHNRNHTMQMFKDNFLKIEECMVVFKPILDLPDNKPNYINLGTSFLSEAQPEMAKLLGKQFENIKGYCDKCNNSIAKVGYYDQGYFDLTKGTIANNSLLNPPKNLCLKCALSLIEPILRNCQKPFSDIFVKRDYIEDSVYFSETEIN